jgi:hypothetical protein
MKMTYDEWVATEIVVDDKSLFSVVEDNFGYVPESTVAAHFYCPGVLVRLANGSYFTHIDRSEYTGTLQEVREVLWRGHASIERQ